VHEIKDLKLDFNLKESGNYRVELWLELLGQPHCWILSSPIYIKPYASHALEEESEWQK